VYLALEGGHGFRNRVEAWRRRHPAEHREPVPFYLLDVSVDLVADHKRLIPAIRVQLGGKAPVLLIVDTLNRALMGDENKSDDMAKFIRAADTIRAAFGCLVAIVHHCGTAGGRPRGHTSLTGADDAQIAVERDDADNVVATVEHAKDFEAGAVVTSKLERVELGTDDDGDPIASCVIVPVEGAVEAKAKGPKLAPAVKLALDQLHELIASDASEPAPASNHVPQNVRVCPAVLWREHFYSVYPGKPDTKQKAFVRACLKLQELHLIGLWKDRVWVAGHAGHGQTNSKCPADDWAGPDRTFGPDKDAPL
jgi:hypothetical protein